MIRRRFLGMIGAAGASSLAAVASLKHADRRTVTYRVDGFTCVTCAVGLETVLLREKGIIAAKATYPDGIAVVTFDHAMTSNEAIAMLITGMGFQPHLQG